ncbi:UNVERIFIED_CONTAM: hypothetical protein PO554_26685, partial [Klebsiella pneumoniae]
GDGMKSFQGMSDLRAGQPVIAVPSVRLTDQKAAFHQLGQVGACCLGSNAGRTGQFAGRQGFSAQKTQKHGDTGRLPDEGRDFHNIGAGTHRFSTSFSITVPHPSFDLKRIVIALKMDEWKMENACLLTKHGEPVY